MANRYYNQFRLALEKQVVDIYATVFIGTSGVPTLEAWSNQAFAVTAYASATNGYKGVKSVVRNDTGSYKFTFQDNYQRLLGVSYLAVPPSGAMPTSIGLYVSGTTAQSASVTSIQTTAGATVNVQHYGTGSSAVELGAGERAFYVFTFGNSSAQ